MGRSFFEDPVNHQQHDGAADRYQQTAQIKTADRSEADSRTDKSPQKCAGNPQDNRDDEPARIFARHQKLCNNPNEQTQNFKSAYTKKTSAVNARRWSIYQSWRCN